MSNQNGQHPAFMPTREQIEEAKKEIKRKAQFSDRLTLENRERKAKGVTLIPLRPKQLNVRMSRKDHEEIMDHINSLDINVHSFVTEALLAAVRKQQNANVT